MSEKHVGLDGGQEFEKERKSLLPFKSSYFTVQVITSFHFLNILSMFKCINFPQQKKCYPFNIKEVVQYIAVLESSH